MREFELYKLFAITKPEIIKNKFTPNEPNEEI